MFGNHFWFYRDPEIFLFSEKTSLKSFFLKCIGRSKNLKEHLTPGDNFFTRIQKKEMAPSYAMLEHQKLFPSLACPIKWVLYRSLHIWLQLNSRLLIWTSCMAHNVCHFWYCPSGKSSPVMSWEKENRLKFRISRHPFLLVSLTAHKRRYFCGFIRKNVRIMLYRCGTI